jgi:hypothetical protein
MPNTFRSVLLVVLSVTTGCLDNNLADTSQALKGAGGGSGGGGTGTGAVISTSASLTCDDGTGLVVALSKGSSNQLQMQMLVTSAVASPPQGFLDVALTDPASGALVNGFGSWPSALVAGLGITNLSHGLPVGTYTLDFTAIVHDGSTAADPALVSCTTSLVATFK